MGNYGIKVNPTGGINSSNLWEYTLHSSYPHLKIKSKTIGSVYIETGKSDMATIYHGLGYKPMWNVLAEKSSGYYVQLSWSDYCGAGMIEFIYAYSDNNNLYIVYDSPCSFSVGSYANYIAFIYYDPFS